jgi:hypothetical protein
MNQLKAFALQIYTARNVFYDTCPNFLPGSNVGYALNLGRIQHRKNAAKYAIKKSPRIIVFYLM